MDRTKTMPYTVNDMINLYEYLSSGHFFDKDTMRFFKSRVLGDFKRLDDKTALFITTEKGELFGRRATLRLVQIVDSKREDGDLVSKMQIETVGEFNNLSIYEAKKLLRKFDENALVSHLLDDKSLNGGN